MSLRRYVPSGRATPRAIAAVLIASVVAGVLTGVVEGIAARWLALFFVFPLLIGALAGAGARRAIDRFKLRAPAIALVLGVLGGTAGYLADHVTEYLSFRHDLARGLRASDPAITDAAIDAAIDRHLTQEAGAPGIVGFHELVARRGVTLKRESYDPGLKLTGTQAWILWLLELVTSAVVGGVIAFRRAREPFCENCENWFAREVTVQTNGAGTPEMRAQMIAAIERGDTDAAAIAFFGPRPAKYAHRFHLTMRACPRGGRGVGYFQLYRLTPRRKTQKRRLAHWLMSEPDRDRFTAALDHTAATRPAM
jgi:hypothetical protein